MNSKIKIVITSAVIALVLLLSGCEYLPMSKSTTVTTTTTAVTAVGQTSTAETTATTTQGTSSWTLPVTTTGGPELNNYVTVIAKVKPSVVAINVTLTAYDIFNRQYTQEGAGTGWILDSSGLIATNNHVIDGATTIDVNFADGSSLPATVLGADTIADLAVLKVDKTGLTAARVGDSSVMQIGDQVIALGNSLGEGISATNGIISRSGVSITTDSGETLSDLIQTNASINSGNSGGPLVNMKGEVIGITSAKLAAVGVEGMGYAISTKTALPIFDSLINKGYVVRPYLGVRMESVSNILVLRYNLGTTKGAFLDEIVAGSPADKAGLQAGDVIVKFNGTTVNTAGDAQSAIRAAQIGQTVSISYYRGPTR